MSAELADELRALAGRVRRLLPSNRDPEAFHVEKDAINHDLRRLANRIAPARRPAPKGMRVGTITTQIVVNGRIVAVQQHRPAFAV